MSKELRALLEALAKVEEKRKLAAQKMQALNAKAAGEKRDLNEAESAEFDALEKAVDEATAEIAAFGKKIETQKKIDAAIAASAVPLNLDGGGSEPAARIVIPAQARHRVGALKSFKGSSAEEDAYVAGMFLLATIGRAAPGRATLNQMGERAAKWLLERGMDVFTKAQNEGTVTAGGYLVPTAMETAIIDLREQYGTARRFLTVTPMASDKQTQPIRTGGLTAYWVDEAAQITESEKTWGQVALSAKKLAALSRMSSELNEDAVISIADDLAREMAYAFAIAEDSAMWNGDGSSSYGGIYGVRTKMIEGALATHAASMPAITANHDTFPEIDKTDLEIVMGACPLYVQNPRWYCSQNFWINVLMRLATAAGGTTMTERLDGRRVPVYQGYDVVIDQTLPKLGGTGTDYSDVIMAFFGDLSMAAKMGERRGITIGLSDQRYWEYDQIGIRATERVDIVAHSLGDATNPGPLLGLLGD